MLKSVVNQRASSGGGGGGCWGLGPDLSRDISRGPYISSGDNKEDNVSDGSGRFFNITTLWVV